MPAIEGQPMEGELTRRAATMTTVAMGLGSALAGGDLNILATNISVVRRGLQFSTSTTSFVAVVATLTMAASALGAGVVGRVYGMKRMFLIGACGAVAFGILAAAAPNVVVLIIARVGSGASFAFLFGLSLAIINAVFPAERRASAIAMYMAVCTGLSVLPPTVGSELVKHFGWRAGFLVAPALAVVVVALTLRYVPDTPRSARKIDIPGMVLMAVALLGLINGISRLQTGLNLTAMVPTVIGAVSAAAFVMWERHTDVPALDLRIFRSARFVGALSAGAALNVVAGGASVVLVYYLVIIRAEPTESYALLLIPATLIGAAASVAAGRAAARFGDRNVLLVGLTLLLAALLGQLLLKLDSSLALPAVLMAMSAFGGALVVVPQATIMMASAPTELGGVVSAVRSSVGMTAYSLGSAFFSLVGVTLGMRAGNAQFAGTGITAEWARDALRVAHGADISADGGAGPIDPEQTQRIVSEMAQIMVDTIHVLTLIMAVVPAIAMAAVLFLVRGKQQSAAVGPTGGPDLFSSGL